MSFNWGYFNYRKLGVKQKSDAIIERSKHREEFFRLAVQMVTIAEDRKLRLVMENPWSEQTFLKNGNFVKAPDVVDTNRSRRGDFRIKPTAYWFFSCKNEMGFTYQPYNGKIKTHMEMKQSPQSGLCSEERSMISPDYARNFICDFILGKKQDIGQLSLF